MNSNNVNLPNANLELFHLKGREGHTLFKYHSINEKSQEDTNTKGKQIYKKLNLSRWVTLGNKLRYAFEAVSF